MIFNGLECWLIRRNNRNRGFDDLLAFFVVEILNMINNILKMNIIYTHKITECEFML